MLRYFIRRVGGGLLLARRVVCSERDHQGRTCSSRRGDAGSRRPEGVADRGADGRRDRRRLTGRRGAGDDDRRHRRRDDRGGRCRPRRDRRLGVGRVGGYEMDDAIVGHVDNAQHLLIGPGTAEAAKIACGSAWNSVERPATQVAGRDRITGQLRRTTITSDQVRAAIEQSVGQIVEAVKRTLETTPPELAADISSSGILLAGGGGLLPGIDDGGRGNRRPGGRCRSSARVRRARCRKRTRGTSRARTLATRRSRVPRCGARAGAPEHAPDYGRMFWFRRKTLSGSQARFSADEPLVLRVAVDRAHDVVARVGDVVHVAAGRRERLDVCERGAHPRAAVVVERLVVPEDLGREPEAASRPVKAVASSGTAAIARPIAQAENSPSAPSGRRVRCSTSRSIDLVRRDARKALFM